MLYSSMAPLDPNAPPYLHQPHIYFYFHPHLYTYNIHFQPTTPISLPPPPAKHINLSRTPVPSGPRIPKSRCLSALFVNSNAKVMKWVPKIPENKVVVENLTTTRWKNNRRGYQTVLPLEKDTTSLMIKNIPNKYTRKLLIETLDNHCQLENKKINNRFVSSYDFVYLPIDFNRRTNAGFAFVNFTNPEAALGFRDAFNGKRWNLFDSPKVAEITRARIQGKNALINNCKGMDFSYGSEEDMPMWFAPARDGSGDQGRSKMFMVGKSSWAKIRSGN